MDQLSDSLRLAAADPPPTAIDLDRLIDGEHHAARRRRWLGAAGGTAAVVTAIAAGVALIHGYGASARGTPFANPSPTAIQKTAEPGPHLTAPIPTEPASEAIPRLTEAFRQAVRALSSGPGGAELPVIEPDPSTSSPLPGPTPDPSSTPSVYAFSGGPDSGYKALFTVTDAAGYTSLQIIIQSAPLPTESECLTYDASALCQLAIEPDGTKIYRVTVPTPQGGPTVGVHVYRPDGTLVWLSESNVKAESDGPEPDKTPRSVTTRPQPALTPDQLVRIASAPGLTLFP